MKSLYHQDMYNFNLPIKSYWEHSVNTKSNNDKTLDSKYKFDITVIGGGYTGLSCALQLAKKFQYNVCVLEAGHFGFGSSGRNGGFLCMGPTKLSIEQLIKKYGLQEVQYYYKNQVDNKEYFLT